MSARLRPLALALVGCAMAAGVSSPRAQQGSPGLPAPTYIPQTQFETGQDVVPF